MSGFTNYGLKAALEAVLPKGTYVYVTLFTVAPSDDGDGSDYTELPLGGWFNRVLVNDWVVQTVGVNNVRKANGSNIQFGQNTTGATVTVVAVGIFDASTSGNLLAWQPIRDPGAADVEIPVDIPDLDTPLIGLEQLRIGFGPEADEISGATVTTEDTVQTTDATPTVLRIAANLGTDGDAVHIECWVRGKSTTLNKNYYRHIVASYHRDDADAGSELWSLREQTTDGVDTRAPGNTPFTTATTYLQRTGNRVDLYVVGEAATTIDWAATVKVTQD